MLESCYRCDIAQRIIPIDGIDRRLGTAWGRFVIGPFGLCTKQGFTTGCLLSTPWPSPRWECGTLLHIPRRESNKWHLQTDVDCWEPSWRFCVHLEACPKCFLHAAGRQPFGSAQEAVDAGPLQNAADH